MDDNPATRLWNILVNAQRVAGEQTAHKAFAKIFGTEEIPAIFRCLGLAHQVIAEIEQKARAIEGIDHGLYLDWMPHVKLFFSPMHLGQRWDQHRAVVDGADLKSLQFCAHALQFQFPELEIPSDDLQNVMDVALELEFEITSSQIPPDLKSVLLAHVDIIRTAIRDYRIRGATGIREAFETAVGALTLHNQELQTAGANLSSAGTIQKTFQWLKRIETMLSVATHSQALLPAAVAYYWPLLQAAAEKISGQ